MMMLKSGDSNLNRFSHAFWESAMGSLKQAILGQELTFRDQVRDLHRLYWTQRNLMKELRQNALNEQFGSALYRNEYALFRNHQSNFKLQLPADAFITIDLNDTNSLLETDLSQANGKFDVEKSLLSSVDSGCNEIIDLEDSVDLDSHEKAELSLKENNVCYVPSTVHFGGVHGRRSKEQMTHVSCVGIENSSLDSLNDHSRNTDESRTVLFDLNMPARNSDVHNSSQDSKMADNNTKHFNDIESKLDANILSSAYPVVGSTGSTDEALISINEAPISSIELSKQEKGGVSSSDKLHLVAVFDNNWQDSNITSKNSITLLQTVTRDSTEKPSNDEKSEEDTLSSHATAEDVAQQNALLVKTYVGYNTNDMSECSSHEKEARGPATLSVTDDSVITQSHSTENEMSFFDKIKSEEQDIATTAAAHTLMDIYFGRSAITTNKLDVFEVREVPCEDNSDDQLQVSSDSFETMTMHLSEIQNVEIMPEVARLNVREKDETRIRPRRGKGLRNFQKEILPGLVSLSRHEICEDLYGINYKFRRNTSSATENFFVPVTSRRSRIYSGRRRR